MKKVFITGVLATAIIGASFTFAQTSFQNIDVAFNAASIEVDGQKLDADVITYNGKTYAPVKDISQAFGKQVEWDEQTSTVIIKSSPFSFAGMFDDVSDLVQTMLGVVVGGIITYMVIIKKAIKKLKS
ncbi:hypothetical protein EAL2_808p02500 (plasmid) [Peptoclostridium acidaminophilum DSM 3953]|uniref:Copper amine oxidase-like N-terminal domain-containing protein n=1 Tax=Peptoclostridium acidaminophilum DSM 3953 TaxID=1286171 RepID=W8TA38_PEPAC|nr:stalk domain-containing protein [Peptoclostridium acidaminophilum]AHM57755.1 hypothetical protein EAL2_808p02500 [Peptoclostridium acidaminophilum DSM 3953]